MPRIKLSDELKKAIIGMPIREKDKLLLRLAAKDDKLVEQLQFRLIENGETTEERRQDCSELIKINLESIKEYRYFSAARLLFKLRKTSGRITRHVQVTGDKYGDVSLNLEMLLLSLEEYGHKFPKNDSRKLRSLNSYIVKRTQKIVRLIHKLHEDYQLDFMDDLAALAELIDQPDSLREKAAELELDTLSLSKGILPEI